ncbi:MAG: hypothetical protein KTR16_01945 [Acidiferrobacterales bacterium]|nr:hypothetical protein [Acidiferrobacterales bacterium]
MNTQAKQNRPTAIVLADHSLQGNLKTVFGETEVASLVVAGYTILDHLLMELRDLGFEQCIVLAKQSAKQLQARFGKSQRWGMTITVLEYSLTKDQVLREYKSLSEPNGLLVFEMDRLRSHSVKSLLEMSEDLEYSLFEGTVGGNPIGITYLKHTRADFIINANSIELDGVAFNGLNDCRDFHRANFELVSGLYDGLEPSVQCNSEKGLRQHWASRVHKNSELHANDNMIERRCQVGSRAKLDSVILNHDVYVERDANLTNSVVMANSVISNQLPINNAIVNNGQIFQIH